METFLSLLLMCFFMFLATFAFGYFPLAFDFKKSWLKTMTIFGAGLLVGTALIVIIPEGIHTLYHIDVPEEIQPLDPATSTGRDISQISDQKQHSLSDEHNHSHGAAHHCLHANTVVHRHIGAALAIGFVFMLFIDKLSGEHHGHSHGHGKKNRGHNADLEEQVGLVSETKRSEEAINHNGNGNEADSRASKNTASATIGLLVHAAVDGVALGAVTRNESGSLEALVFVALMLHKAPAAFALGSFLLDQGRSRRDVSRHVLLFSSMAPLLAIITFVFLGFDGSDPEHSNYNLGICLLFSAGTFLYVSTVHVIPELSPHGAHALSWGRVVTLVAGVLVPLVINIEHNH